MATNMALRDAIVLNGTGETPAPVGCNFEKRIG